MRFSELQKAVEANLFTLTDIKKHFPEEKDQTLVIQLFRFKQKGLLQSPKRGLYCLSLSEIPEFELANQLYKPSYISLESALSYYGMIPDVPQRTISVGPIQPKEFKTQVGMFIYHRIKTDLYWGFEKIASGKDKHYFLMAEREKALLDFFYLREVKKTTDLRLNLSDFDLNVYRKYQAYYPDWVGQIKLK